MKQGGERGGHMACSPVPGLRSISKPEGGGKSERGRAQMIHAMWVQMAVFVERPCNGTAASASGQAWVGAREGGVRGGGRREGAQSTQDWGGSLTYSNPNRSSTSPSCCACTANAGAGSVQAVVLAEWSGWYHRGAEERWVARQHKKEKRARDSLARKGREERRRKVEWHEDGALGIGMMCVRCETTGKRAAKSSGGVGACVCAYVREDGRMCSKGTQGTARKKASGLDTGKHGRGGGKRKTEHEGQLRPKIEDVHRVRDGICGGKRRRGKINVQCAVGKSNGGAQS